PGPGAKFQVSASGGRMPKWRADGKELYYMSTDQKLMAAPIALGATTLQVGDPRALFGIRVPPVRGTYAVSRDGRFLVNSLGDASDTVPISLFTNWPATLRK